MAGYERKRGDNAQPFEADLVREPNDDSVDLTGLSASNITVRIRALEGTTSIIDEAVDSIESVKNPARVRWKAAGTELDIEPGDYFMSFKVQFASGPERFPVRGFIPLRINQNIEKVNV